MLEIYDCTLREGEQTEGASFSLRDRIDLCRLLDSFGVDYIELGWPQSNRVRKAFRQALDQVKKAKIVAFGSTSRKEDPEQDANLNAIVETGVNHACIFGKSDIEHVQKQLKISRQENLDKIFNSVKYLRERGLVVFYDAEHYFDGYKRDSEYALSTLESAIKGGAETVILCDTNGGTLPNQAEKIVRETKEALGQGNFEARLGVHFHDDCGLALANTLACLSYIDHVQGTINGTGERVGNLNFSEFLPVYVLKMGNRLNVDLPKLKEVNEASFRLCGMPVPDRRAFVGNTAFSHVGGVHIDAELKGARYTHINPKLVGNESRIVLNSLGGRSSVIEIAGQFGYDLDKNDIQVKEKIEGLFEELKRYEEAGYRLGSLRAEQFLLVEKYFGDNPKLFEIKSWNSGSERSVSGKEMASFYAVCDIGGELVDGKLNVEGGPVDSAFNTLKSMLADKYHAVKNLHLLDFQTGIANPREEKSTVRTEILFRNGEVFSTVGVDSNMIGASVEALYKGFCYHLLRNSWKELGK